MLKLFEQWKQSALKATDGMPEFYRFNSAFSTLLSELQARHVPDNAVAILFDMLFQYHSSPCSETKRAFMHEYSITISWLMQNGYN